MFEINIFAYDKSPTVRAPVIINELKTLVNEVFEDVYGMTREQSRPVDNIDKYIARQYMRYSCILNLDDNRIFRRK